MRTNGMQSRRKIWQAWRHLETIKTTLFNERNQAKKDGHLDEVQHLSEAVFHTARATAHLRAVCKHRYHCELEDLKNYA